MVRAADALIARTVRGAWPSLPALAVASAFLCAAATLPVLVAIGLIVAAIFLFSGGDSGGENENPGGGETTSKSVPPIKVGPSGGDSSGESETSGRKPER